MGAREVLSPVNRIRCETFNSISRFRRSLHHKLHQRNREFRAITQTHDYKRHGTVTLFAALNYLDGKILSRTETRHTHVE
jgi:hypothetical protein